MIYIIGVLVVICFILLKQLYKQGKHIDTLWEMKKDESERSLFYKKELEEINRLAFNLFDTIHNINKPILEEINKPSLTNEENEAIEKWTYQINELLSMMRTIFSPNIYLNDESRQNIHQILSRAVYHVVMCPYDVNKNDETIKELNRLIHQY